MPFFQICQGQIGQGERKVKSLFIMPILKSSRYKSLLISHSQIIFSINHIIDNRIVIKPSQKPYYPSSIEFDSIKSQSSDVSFQKFRFHQEKKACQFESKEQGLQSAINQRVKYKDFVSKLIRINSNNFSKDNYNNIVFKCPELFSFNKKLNFEATCSIKTVLFVFVEYKILWQEWLTVGTYFAKAVFEPLFEIKLFNDKLKMPFIRVQWMHPIFITSTRLLNSRITEKCRLLQKYLRHTSCDEIRMYPKEDYVGYIELKRNPTLCDKCQEIFCSIFLHKFHTGSCDKSEVKFLVANYHYQRCINCKLILDRNDGCLHMICQCGYQFCYLCGN